MINLRILNAVTDICENLDRIHNIEDLRRIALTPMENIEIISNKNFSDLPHNNLPILKSQQFYSEIFGNICVQDSLIWAGIIKFPFLYIDGPHGPWVVIDFINDMISMDSRVYLEKSGNFNNLHGSFYSHKRINCFIEYAEFTDIEKYLALIGIYEGLFNHPRYTGSKISYYFNNNG